MGKLPKFTWVLIYIISILTFSIFGFMTGYISRLDKSANLLAVSWGDGKYGKAFYGAQIFAYPVVAKYRVEAYVTIGQGNPYYHDIGILGRVATWQEARDKYGNITWTPAGLNIGSSSKVEYYLPRAKLENHR